MILNPGRPGKASVVTAKTSRAATARVIPTMIADFKLQWRNWEVEEGGESKKCKDLRKLAYRGTRLFIYALVQLIKERPAWVASMT